MSEPSRILFCRCAFAQVLPEQVKNEVLQRLVESDRAFDAVPDLCEMSARKDPTLKQLAGQKSLAVVACYPRAVKWLFSAAGAPLDADGPEIFNMRTDTADQICDRLIPQTTASNQESVQ